MRDVECAHCGLPTGGGVFCCYGCFLASRIVGGVAADGGPTASTWAVLRLAVGAMLSMAVMMTALLLYTGSVEPHLEPAFRWIMLAQSLPAAALLGWPFVAGSAVEIRRGRLSLDALIAGGALSALGVSVAATVQGQGHVYFDTATMLLTVVTLGKLIEASAKTRAGQWLDSLERLLPPRATRLSRDGQAVDVARGELRPGDWLIVAPGERFPADGEVVEGRSVVAEAAFTGEWQPREIGPGSPVTGGTVNGDGSWRGRPARVDRSIRLTAVERQASPQPHAGETPAPRESGSGPVVMLVQAVGEELLLRRIVERVRLAQRQPGRIERQARRMAAWMTPCVLVLALSAGVGWLAAGDPARAGRAALAVLVVACPCAMGIAAPLAAALAIARAAEAGALVRGGDVLESLGLVGLVFFDKTGTLTLGRPPGGDAAARDQPRPDARTVVTELERMGIAVSMLSGDSATAAADMAGQLNIRDVHAPRRPDEKADLIAAARTARRDAVAMVGDGVNDAPALAQADVGVALADGCDLARHAGDVVLLNSRLATLPRVIRLARHARRVIRQNLAWALAYNTAALATAAAGVLHPLLAAVLMAASCVTVVANSLRLA